MEKAKEEIKETCGIIMPISGNDSYTSEHWVDVRLIIEEVIKGAGFMPNLVSDADEIGIIHNRIVSNIYSNPIIVCDVSSKNPNVMFELGLRLAFDKATIIIKDDATNYNFDTAPIEHLTYPKDLRYSIINKFKDKLKDKLLSTHKASLKPDYSTFLKNFVQYKPKLEIEEIGSQEFILKQLEQISKQLIDLKRPNTNSEIIDKELVRLQRSIEPYFIEFIEREQDLNLKNFDESKLVDIFIDHIFVTGIGINDSVISRSTLNDLRKAVKRLVVGVLPLLKLDKK